MKLHLGHGLTLPVDAVTQTFGVLAKRGVGKTYLALVLVEELLKAEQHVVVADPVGVCWGLRSSADGKAAGLAIVVMGGDHGDVPLEVTAGELVADFVVEERQSVVLDLSRFRKGEQVRFMTDFCERLYHRNRQPLHLVLDEADAFAPQRPQHGQERMLGAVEDLVRRGRARGIGVTLVTQRAAVLNKDVLTQVEVLIALRTIAPQDREAIDAWVKVHGTPTQRETMMSSLASLPVGEAWFWSPGWLDVFQRVKVRQRLTFDSSATPKAGVQVKAPKSIAAVDLERLKTRIAATIERAKANDPAELRREVARLRSELANRSRSAVATTVERVEVPIIRPAEAARLEGTVARMEKFGERLLEAGKELRESAIGLTTAIRASRGPSVPGPRPPLPTAERQRTPAPHEATSRVVSTNGTRTSAKSGGDRRMLAVLAHFAGRTLSRVELGVQALVHPSGGSFDTYVGRLVGAGHAERRADGFSITSTGHAAADTALYLDTDALVEGWRRRLGQGNGARRMFDVLLGIYPDALHRDDLGRAAQVSPDGGSFDTYLGRLTGPGLAERVGGGARLSAALFLETA